MKLRRKKDFKIAFFILMLFSLTVGYSLVTVNLNITGKGKMSKTIWDVHLENLSVMDGSVVAEVPAEISTTNPTEVNYTVRLEEPGDFYKFKVDIVNAGGVDAMLATAAIDNSLQEGEKAFYDYTVEYENGIKVKANDGLRSEDRKTIVVTIKYKEVTDEADLITTETTKNCTLNLEYVQADETANFSLLSRMKNLSSEVDTALSAYYENVLTINFEDTINVPNNAVKTFDISEAGDNTVVACVVPNTGDSTKYDLYIQSVGGVLAPVNSSNLFSINTIYTTINGLDKLKTTGVTNMSGMFFKALALQSLDLSSFDTSKVTDMTEMFSMQFEVSENLKSINLSSFDTSKVIDMTSMFKGCGGLTSLNLSSFDTRKVYYMDGMFSRCGKLTDIDLSNFKTPQLNSTTEMFSQCSSLKTVNLSNADFRNVSDISWMFLGCSSLTSIDFSNVDFQTSCTKMEVLTEVPDGIYFKVKDSTAKAFIGEILSNENKSGAADMMHE